MAEGEKVVAELLDSQIEVLKIFATHDFEGRTPPSAIRISPKDMARLSAQSTPPGLMAIARIPQSNWIGPARGISLYLDGIADPGNLGTIIRTADWFGVQAILLSPECTDPFGPKVVQSAMGSLFRQAIHTLTSNEVIEACKSSKIPVICTTLSGTALSTWKTPKNALVVVGSESHGVSKAMLQASDEQITIGRAVGSKTESLNAGVATAIVLHHISTH